MRDFVWYTQDYPEKSGRGAGYVFLALNPFIFDYGRLRGGTLPQYGKKGFLMMRFPKNSDLLETWTTALGRSGWKPSNNSRICHEHFDEDQWAKYPTQLKPDALPRRFCTCGFAAKLSSASKVKQCSQDNRLDHNHTKLLTPTKENIPKPVNDHGYSTTKLAPTVEASESKDSRKIPCATNCPCRTLHLESCVMSHILKIGTPLKERKVLLICNPSNQGQLPAQHEGPNDPAIQAESGVTSSQSAVSNVQMPSQSMKSKKQTPSQSFLPNEKCCPELVRVSSDPLVLDLLEQNKSLREEIKLMKDNLKSANMDGSEKQSCSKENNKSGYLNDDQNAALDWGTTRGREWSNATIKKGLQLRHACNTNG